MGMGCLVIPARRPLTTGGWVSRNCTCTLIFHEGVGCFSSWAIPIACRISQVLIIQRSISNVTAVSSRHTTCMTGHRTSVWLHATAVSTACTTGASGMPHAETPRSLEPASGLSPALTALSQPPAQTTRADAPSPYALRRAK